MKQRRIDRRCVLTAGWLVLLTNGLVHAQTRLFVRANYAGGTNAGESWANAFRENHAPAAEERGMMAALAYAQSHPSVTEIWTAAGTYNPANPNGPRTATFLIPTGVAVYGGFVGSETRLDQRDYYTNVATLSGDLNHNDQFIYGQYPNSNQALNFAENVNYVVTVDAATATRLDGVTIRGGKQAGVISLNNGFLDLAHSIVQYNILGVIASAPVFTSTIVVDDCTVQLNAADGISLNGNGSVSDCLIAHNSGIGVSRGGAFMERTTLFDNGGGSGDGPPMVSDCKYIGNRGTGANATAGGIFINCLFSGNNRARQETGGGIRAGCPNGNCGANCLRVISCTFVGNFSASSVGPLGWDGFGGAIWVNLGPPGSFVCPNNGYRATIVNNIFWRNSDMNGSTTSFESQVAIRPASPCCPSGNGGLVLDQNLFESSGAAPANCGPPQIYGNPQFADDNGPDNIIGTLDDDLHLLPNSAAIDRGWGCYQCWAPPACSLITPPSLDLDGLPRVVNNLVDLGCYERQLQPTISDIFWRSATGGFFQTANNWMPNQVPGRFDRAIFDQLSTGSPGYDVFFTDDADVFQLLVQSQRDIRLKLSDHNLNINGDDAPNDPSFVVGRNPLLDARLSVENNFSSKTRGITCSRLSIADGVNSKGQFTLRGPLVTVNSFADWYIGRASGALGKIRFESAATGSFTSENVSIGSDIGSTGEFTIIHDGSIFYVAGVGPQARADLVIGESGDGTLTVREGGALIADSFMHTVSIAKNPGSIGSLTITGTSIEPARAVIVSQGFTIGDAGDGSLSITDGGELYTTTFGPVTLAAQTGSTATLIVAGPGSYWLEQSAAITFGGLGAANVYVANGGIIEDTGNSPINIFPLAVVSGDGTLRGEVANQGEIRPGDPGQGAFFTIEGDYRQTSSTPGKNDDSGSLIIDMAGTRPGMDYDQLVVTGQAELAGGLFINLFNDFLPQVSQAFDVLTSNSITTTFDVAFMPNIIDPQNPRDAKFLRVDYSTGSALGPAGVHVVVAPLPGPLDFGNPNAVNISGAPTAAAIGLLNSDANLDLAITINGTPTSSPGALLILFGDGQGNFTLQAQQPATGVQPSGIAIGNFNNATGEDIAISNAGDNNVMVRFNNGTGNFGNAPTLVPLPPGDQHPQNIAAATLDNIGSIDLVVVNANSNNARVLVNNGAGVFAPGQSAPTGPMPVVVNPADVDNDRDNDLVIANHGGNSVIVLRNSVGVFGLGATIPVGNAPIALRVADLNRDNPNRSNTFPEIVTANFGDGTVSVIINHSTNGTNPLVFAPAVNLPAGAQARSLALVPLNDDPRNPMLDPDRDIAVVVTDDSNIPVVRVLRNDLTVNGMMNQQLTFATGVDLTTGSNTQFVLSGDVDGEPGEDLIAVDAASGSDEDNELPLRLLGPANQVAVLPNHSLGPAPAQCPADIAPAPNGNGFVNVDDLLLVINSWGACGVPCPPHCRADIAPQPNGNCFVNVDDLLLIINSWGPCSQ